MGQRAVIDVGAGDMRVAAIGSSLSRPSMTSGTQSAISAAVLAVFHAVIAMVRATSPRSAAQERDILLAPDEAHVRDTDG